MTFSRPPLRAGRAARRDASAIALASASSAMKNVSGSRAARRSTAEPDPVPISMDTREWRAIRSVN